MTGLDQSDTHDHGAQAPARLRLAASFDASAAAALQRELGPALAAAHELVLEAADVERVSTAGIQLLLAAALSLGAHDGRLVLADPAPVLCAALEDLGLAAELQQWRADQ